MVARYRSIRSHNLKMIGAGDLNFDWCAPHHAIKVDQWWTRPKMDTPKVSALKKFAKSLPISLDKIVGGLVLVGILVIVVATAVLIAKSSPEQEELLTKSERDAKRNAVFLQYVGACVGCFAILGPLILLAMHLNED